MRNGKFLVLIFGILGAFYLFLPHEIHISSGVGFDLDHSVHQILGLVLLFVAFIITWQKKRSIKTEAKKSRPKRKPKGRRKR